MTIALLAGGFSEAAVVRITSEVDENWRGVYDILVRPAGARLGLEETAGVVEPNFLGFAGGGGISRDQLAAVRSISGVELAAPVAFVGYIRTIITAPAINIPTLPDRPALYRLTIEATSWDGLSSRLISRHSALALIGPINELADVDQWASTFGDSGAAQFADGTFSGELLSRQTLPAIASPVLAVDPVAEAELLGDSGAFLEPLRRVREITGDTVGTFDATLVPTKFEWAANQLRSLTAASERTRSRPIVPIVVSDSLFARLSLTLEVTQLGESLHAYPTAEQPDERLDAAAQVAGPGEHLIGREELDLSEALRPFQGGQMAFTWPGTTATQPPGQLFSLFANFEARLAGRPIYSEVAPRTGSSDVSLRIEPVGVVGPDQNPAPPISPDAELGDLVEGREMAYRSLTSVDLPIAEGFEPEPGTSDYPFVFAPLGEFDLGGLDLPDNPVNYVPLGAYDPPTTNLVADPAGRPVEAKAVVPTLNPAGLIAVPPLAVTDIDGGVLLRGDRPIDAVRVRVSGLTDFSPNARAKVESVASSIAGLGLDVDIVAGSSPQQVEVFVPAYSVDTEAPVDLGWIEQRWTTLGAAERVERSLGQVSATLLGLALIAGLIIPIATVIGTLGRRVREAAIMISLGWTPARAGRWQVAEAAAGATIVALAGVAAWALVGRSVVALATTLVMAATYLAVSWVGASLVVRRASSGISRSKAAGDLWLSAPRSGSMAVDGLTSYALRSLVAKPARTVISIATATAGITAMSLGMLMVLSLAALAGPTLLATSVSAGVRVLQLGTLGTIAAGCITFSVILARHDVREGREELVALASAGWRRRDTRAMLALTQILPMVPTFAIASLASAALAQGLVPGSGLTAAWLATVATILVTILGAVVVRAPDRLPA